MRKWLKIGGGIAVGVTTIVGLFSLLVVLYNFEITDLTGDYACVGTYDNPCLFEFSVKNPKAYDVDIYSKDQVKLDFSPDITDYALFVPDGRCSATGSCRCELKNGEKIGFKGWRCVDFTNKTKPLEDKVYNFRFAKYSTTTFKLALIKPHPAYEVKWGFGVSDGYMDPIAESTLNRFAIKSINGKEYVEFTLDNGFVRDTLYYDNTTNIEYYFANETGNYVYGAIGNNTELKNYIYISNSTNRRIYENGEYWIIDSKGKWKQHFDVCDKTFENGTISANCSFREWTEERIVESEFGISSYISNYILEVSFISDNFIDPTFTFNEYPLDALTQNATSESTFSHIATREDIGLVSYWNFDADKPWRDGIIDKSVYFDGNNGNYIDFGNKSADKVNNNFTVSVWVYREGGAANQGFIGKTGDAFSTTVNSWVIGSGSDANSYFGLFNASGVNPGTYYFNVPFNEWNLLTLSVQDNNFSLYQNGVHLVSRINVGELQTLNNTLKLGMYSATKVFNGTFDELMLFNRSLSGEEILSLYNNQSAGLRAYEEDANLYSYLNFDKNYDDIKGNIIPIISKSIYPTTAFDFTTGNRDGTYQGNASTGYGLYGDGLKLNGVDSYVNDNDYFYPYLDELTICSWFKTNSSANQLLIDKSTDFYLYVTGGKLRWYIANTSTDQYTVDALKPVTDGVWHLGCGVVKNDNSPTKVYLDGVVELDNANYTGNIRKGVPELGIGARASGVLPVNGSIDEVMLFNRSLSQAEITAIYQNTSSRFKENSVVYLPYFNISDTSNNYVSINVSPIQTNFNTNISLRTRSWNDEKGYSQSYDSSLISHYGFNSNPFDGLGKNNGMIIGGVTNTTGNFSGAYKFDSTSGYVNISDITNDIQNNKEGTISVWFKAEDTGNYNKAIFASSDGGTSDTVRLYLLQGNIIFSVKKSSSYISGASYNTVKTTYTAGEWTNIITTQNGTAIKLYKNGILEYTGDSGAWFSNITNSFAQIGVYYESSLGGYFNGTIDEVSIFNRSLNDDEIKKLYRIGLADWKYSNWVNASSTNPRMETQILDNTTYFALEVEQLSDPNNFYTPIFGGNPFELTYDFSYLEASLCNITDVILSVWAYSGGKWISGFGNADLPTPVNDSFGELIWNYEGEVGRLVDGVGSTPDWTGGEIVGGCNVTDIALSMWRYPYRYIQGYGSTSYNPSVNSTIGEAVWKSLNGRRLITG